VTDLQPTGSAPPRVQVDVEEVEFFREAEILGQQR
jgi:hypothetical protein